MLRIAFISIAIVLVSCDSEVQTSNNIDVNGASISASASALDSSFDGPIRSIMAGYLEQIDTDYAALSSELRTFESQVDQFLENPETSTMNAVRSGWLTAHSSYELTALHRYFSELLLSEEDQLALFQLQYQINHWPILPGYVDYVGGYLESGLVNDITVNLDLGSLRQQHGVFDLAEASLGFHVLEFLIWGENIDRQSERPASDYQSITELSSNQISNGIQLEQISNNRRRQLLRINTEALLADFGRSQEIWLENSETLRSKLAAMNSAETLILLIEAMTGMLTEEMLVRSLYPLLNGDYIDSIQSPFSHSSQNAVSAQLSSVERLLIESRSTDGRSLDNILVSLSSEFEEFFYQNFDASKECLVLLYSTLQLPGQPQENSPTAAQAEFDVVECINLLTNMIDNLEQIKVSLLTPL